MADEKRAGLIRRALETLESPKFTKTQPKHMDLMIEALLMNAAPTHYQLPENDAELGKIEKLIKDHTTRRVIKSLAETHKNSEGKTVHKYTVIWSRFESAEQYKEGILERASQDGFSNYSDAQVPVDFLLQIYESRSKLFYLVCPTAVLSNAGKRTYDTWTVLGNRNAMACLARMHFHHGSCPDAVNWRQSSGHRAFHAMVLELLAKDSVSGNQLRRFRACGKYALPIISQISWYYRTKEPSKWCQVKLITDVDDCAPRTASSKPRSKSKSKKKSSISLSLGSASSGDAKSKGKGKGKGKAAANGRKPRKRSRSAASESEPDSAESDATDADSVWDEEGEFREYGMADDEQHVIEAVQDMVQVRDAPAPTSRDSDAHIEAKGKAKPALPSSFSSRSKAKPAQQPPAKNEIVRISEALRASDSQRDAVWKELLELRERISEQLLEQREKSEEQGKEDAPQAVERISAAFKAATSAGDDQTGALLEATLAEAQEIEEREGEENACATKKCPKVIAKGREGISRDVPMTLDRWALALHLKATEGDAEAKSLGDKLASTVSSASASRLCKIALEDRYRFDEMCPESEHARAHNIFLGFGVLMLRKLEQARRNLPASSSAQAAADFEAALEQFDKTEERQQFRKTLDEQYDRLGKMLELMAQAKREQDEREQALSETNMARKRRIKALEQRVGMLEKALEDSRREARNSDQELRSRRAAMESFQAKMETLRRDNERLDKKREELEKRVEEVERRAAERAADPSDEEGDEDEHRLVSYSAPVLSEDESDPEGERPEQDTDDDETAYATPPSSPDQQSDASSDGEDARDKQGSASSGADESGGEQESPHIALAARVENRKRARHAGGEQAEESSPKRQRWVTKYDSADVEAVQKMRMASSASSSLEQEEEEEEEEKGSRAATADEGAMSDEDDGLEM